MGLLYLHSILTHQQNIPPHSSFKSWTVLHDMCAVFCLPVDPGASFLLELLEMTLPWTWVYRHVFDGLVWIPLSVYPEAEVLDDMETLFNFPIVYVFHGNYTVLYSECSRMKFSSFCMSLPTLTLFCSFWWYWGLSVFALINTIYF